MPDEFKFPDEVEQKQDAAPPAAVETDVEIEIVDDTPERDRGRKPLEKDVADPTDDEIESYSDGVKKRISELTHARHDERRAKEALLREKQELERFAQHIVEENKRLKQSVNTGNQAFASMAEQAAEAKLEKARRELKAAQEAFDTDAIIAAQEALAEAKWDSQNIKKQAATPLQQEEIPVQTGYTPQQTSRPDEKTLRWQAKNQWFGANGFEEVTSFALGLHQKLVATGVDPRTDEYFEQIDARIKSKFPEVFGEEDTKTERSEAKRPSSVVAPANRSTGVKKVQLTPSQAALIKKYNLDPKKYVAEVLKLEKQNG
jgi:hypothetical protein